MDCCFSSSRSYYSKSLCSACYEGTRSIINVMNNLESEKAKAIASSDGSSVSRPNIHKLDDCKRWCLEQIDQINQQNEDLAFVRGSIAALRAQIYTDILISPSSHDPPIPAHKFVLAARSEIFKNMLECDECKAPPNNTITIPDMNHEGLESLLDFLYNRTLAAEKLEKHAYALFQAADKYVIPDLLKHCEKYLLSSLSTSNALETLEIADTCSNQNLKETTLNFLVKNMEHMVSSPKFEVFVHRSPHLTVQLVTRAFVNDACSPLGKSNPPPSHGDEFVREMSPSSVNSE